MALIYGPFNSINKDRLYNAEWFAQYFGSFIGNGVFPNPSNGLQAIANNSMQVTIKAGKGFINGYHLTNNTDFNVTLPTANASLPRIDRIVIRWSLSTRDINIVVKPGTPNSTPVASALTRTAEVYELGIADIRVNASVISITQSNITDTRLNSNLCGIVHGTVEQVDTTTIFNQYMAYLEEQEGITAAQLQQFRDQQTQFFLDWFNSLQDILQPDVAASLASRILALENQNTTQQNQIDGLSTNLGITTTTANNNKVQIENHLSEFGLNNYYGTAVASANTLSITTTIPFTSYKTGMVIRFKCPITNTGTLSVIANGLTSKAVYRPNNTIPGVGFFKQNNYYAIMYDGTNFILQGEGGVSSGDEIMSYNLTINPRVNGTMNKDNITSVQPVVFDETGNAYYFSNSLLYKNDINGVPIKQITVSNGYNIVRIASNKRNIAIINGDLTLRVYNLELELLWSTVIPSRNNSTSYLQGLVVTNNDEYCVLFTDNSSNTFFRKYNSSGSLALSTRISYDRIVCEDMFLNDSNSRVYFFNNESSSVNRVLYWVDVLSGVASNTTALQSYTGSTVVNIIERPGNVILLCSEIGNIYSFILSGNTASYLGLYNLATALNTGVDYSTALFAPGPNGTIAYLVQVIINNVRVTQIGVLNQYSNTGFSVIWNVRASGASGSLSFNAVNDGVYYNQADALQIRIFKPNIIYRGD